MSDMNFDPERYCEVRMEHLEIGDVILLDDNRECMVMIIDRVGETYYVKVATGGKRDATSVPQLTKLSPLYSTFVPVIRRQDFITRDRNGRAI